MLRLVLVGLCLLGCATADLAPQVRRMSKVAACAGEEPVPARLSAQVVAEHCAALDPLIRQYRAQWLEIAMPFLARLVPPQLPGSVVYPFGGGDLLGALATFPDATEFTLISLEPAGDVRAIDTLPPEQLAASLALLRLHLGKLFEKAHSKTTNLDLEARSSLSGTLTFALVALAVHGYQPTALRYFTLAPDGTLLDTTTQFDNVEIEFSKPGSAQIKRLRHIAWNLHDDHLKTHPALLAHLAAKGKVTVMTKAASHLLWDDGFSLLRDYLTHHLAWIISDTTGLPPRHATHFIQEPHGLYEGPEPFGSTNDRDAEDFRILFRNSTGPLPFRFGYPDNASHGHLVVTRPGDGLR